MKGDYIPLVVGLLVFLASIISLRLGLSVTIIEIALGSLIGNLGLHTEEWMLYVAQFGGIILTYLAGTEPDGGINLRSLPESPYPRSEF